MPPVTLTTLPNMPAEQRVENIRSLLVQAEFDQLQQEVRLVEIDAGTAALAPDGDVPAALKAQLQGERQTVEVALARAKARVELLEPAYKGAQRQRDEANLAAAKTDDDTAAK